MSNEEKLVSKNPTAHHNYEILEKIECGYASVDKNGEVYIYQMHISPYENGNIYNKDPLRPRKLLLNRSEINKLVGVTSQKGYSLIPISLYFKNNRLKVELGIGKGKKLFDRREDIKKKEADMKIKRAMAQD